MFESIMWKYMKEEQSLLLNLVANNNVKENIEKLKDIKALYFLAHGSSYNAATSIASFISKLAKVRTYVYTPSNFRYNAESLNYEDHNLTMAIGISQTGTSRGVLEAMSFAKEKGFKLLGITEKVNSPIEDISDITLYLKCDNEDSNAKTKGYSSTLLLLMILAIELASVKKNIDDKTKEELYLELINQINEIDRTIDKTIDWCKMNNYGLKMNNIYVVGNGMNFGSAMEGQLKIMETQCVPTMFNDIEEFSHGMHRSLDKESNVLLLNSCVDNELMNKTFEYLNNKKIPVLMINANDGNEELTNVIKVTKYEHTESILLITSAIQAISTFIPENNGLDPNRYANNDYTDWVLTRV